MVLLAGQWSDAGSVQNYKCDFRREAVIDDK
jgi:hypothetical protein